MDDLSICGLGLVVLLLLLLLRTPVGVALGVVSFVGIWIIVGLRSAWGILVAIPYDFVAHWTLSSVPMFLLMGYYLLPRGTDRRPIPVGADWLSWLPGGLAVASSVGAAAGFSAVTGSSRRLRRRDGPDRGAGDADGADTTRGSRPAPSPRRAPSAR